MVGFRSARSRPNIAGTRRSSTSRRGGTFLLLALCLGLVACGESSLAPGDDGEDRTQTPSIFADPVTMSASGQLLENGDVELGTTLPDRWRTGGSSAQDFALEWADGVASSGIRSLSMRPAVGPTDAFGFWAQTIEVSNPVGMTFELSVDVRLENVQGDGISLAIRGDNSALSKCCAEAFATTEGRVSISGTQDWTRHVVKLNSLPAGVDRITVYFVYLRSSSGTAYFDDATLSVSPTVPTVALQNTDVEDGDGYPEPWWWSGPGNESYDFVWSGDDASSGARSLAISRVGRHAEQFGFWAQTIDARDFVGGSATLAVRVRTVGLSGQGSAIAIRTDTTAQPQGYAEAFVTTQGSQFLRGTTGWNTVQVTLDDVPPDSESVTVYLIHLTDTEGTVYFDEISLVPG